MNNIKIEELMKVRLDGIANRIGQLSKRESESLLLEHLQWLEGGWETEEILFLKNWPNSLITRFSASLSDNKSVLFSSFWSC